MELRDEGIAIASGLPIKPHQSQLHQFLKEPKLSRIERFIIEIGKRQYEIGQIDGGIVSWDSHLLTYEGEIDLQQDKDSKSAFPVKAIEVTLHLATKLVAYDVISAFRANTGGEYLSHNLATIYEEFFNVQALVKLRGDRIQVTIYGHPREDKIEPLYHNLDEKLKNKGIDPRVPWLNNHFLEFQFK